KGDLYTNNKAIFKYFPELRDFRTMDIEKMGFVHYVGNFVGFIDRFAAIGSLNTALGTIQSDVRLTLPNMDASKAIYAGTISSKGLDVGTLFRQPAFGNIVMSLKVNGHAFDPQNATVNI